ncbi:hypothetical protein ACIQVL_48740 [Streptomyces sp. NPDC090499]|uniref:hypothetical protein n=1 Tax=Streptomyces sp. NPDC090499 TaxID=3365965 RepID=UPI00381279E3
MKKRITRTLIALTIAALATTGTFLATDLTPVTYADTGWGAPATTVPADTGWGTTPTDTTPVVQGDTGWG